jgi:hypothetical protein
MRKCPTCSANLKREEYFCRACGLVLEEVVAVKHVFASADEVRVQFGRFPTFASVFLPVSDPLPEGTLVALRLVLPDGWGEMMIPSRVIAVAHTPSTPETPHKLQMNLLTVDREKRDRLTALIDGERMPDPVATPPVEERPAVIFDQPLPPVVSPYSAPAPPLQAASRSPAPTVAEIEVDLDELLTPLPPTREPATPPLARWVATLEAQRPAGRERPAELVGKVLTDFVSQLTRAIVKTSYYEPEHQAAAHAKIGLYDTFKLLLQDAAELTFLNQSTEGHRVVLVAGIFDEPIELERVMARGQAELVGQKLASYLEGRSLLSVSFKGTLDYAEFHRFIDLLAVPAHLARGDDNDLVKALATQKVRGMSVVFKKDLVTRRKLSWRVGLALTRLKKDLSILPLYEGLSDSELRRVRYEVFRDVVRPLRQVPLLREMLLNCDLVHEAVPILSREDIELLIQEGVAPEMLADLLQRFTKDVVEALREGDDRLADLLRITRNLARRLASSQEAVKEQVFRELFENEVLELTDLPSSLQVKIEVGRRTDRFLEAWRQHLHSFEEVSTPALYRKHLDLLLMVLPELLARFMLDPVVKIALVVARHRAVNDGFPERQAMAAEWLAAVPLSPAGAEIASQVMSADKVRRQALLTLCGVLGTGGVPILFKALSECPTRSIRLELCEILVNLREQTSRFLAAELEKKNIPWYYQRNLLSLLGRVGSDSDLPLVGYFLNDRHPRIRLEALLSVCALDPGAAEKMLVWALADSDPDVRGVAVRQLVERRSAAPELFDHFRSVLFRIEQSDEDKIRQTCLLLASYQAGEGHDLAVDLLLEVLDDGAQDKGFWSILKGQGVDDVKLVACQTLGRLRAKKAVKVLTRLSQGRDRALKQTAMQALRHIQPSLRV